MFAIFLAASHVCWLVNCLINKLKDKVFSFSSAISYCLVIITWYLSKLGLQVTVLVIQLYLLSNVVASFVWLLALFSCLSLGLQFAVLLGT